MKDHQTLLILQFLLENCKKRTFLYKVALKNFHGRAKGGASHRGPPPKYATESAPFLRTKALHRFYLSRHSIAPSLRSPTFTFKFQLAVLSTDFVNWKSCAWKFSCIDVWAGCTL